MTMLRRRIRGSLRRASGLPKDDKQEMIQRAVNAVDSWQVQGDYLEFGLYQGRSLIYAYNAIEQSRNPERRLFGFDSFEGLPEPTAEEGAAKFQPGQYACSRKQVEWNLRRAGVDLNKVQLIEGFYEKSLTPVLAEAMQCQTTAVVWIDCDLYESTVAVLAFVRPLLRTGTVICFDDWFSYGTDPRKGEIRAVEEWLHADGGVTLTQYRDFGLSGRAFVVSLKETSD